MTLPRIIVIGASAGGFEAIQTLISSLPRGLPASIFIVWHMPAEVRGILPQVLNRIGNLPASNASDLDAIEPGNVYVAPPDRHLIIDGDRIRTTRGPKENRFRPAVDPLFRSAAYAYGNRVIGIILSGALDDGTSGLWTVKQRGGVAIVQDQADAAVPSMPQSAAQAVAVDYSLPVAEMGALLEQLCAAPPPSMNASTEATTEDNQRTGIEIRTAMENGPAASEIMSHGAFSPYSCPECHGVLTALQEGGRVRFRCHTGHAYSADALLAEVTASIDTSLWSAIRGVEESVMLLNHLGDHAAEQNQPRLAAGYFRKAADAGNRLLTLKAIVAGTEVLSNDRIGDEPDRQEA